MSHTQNLRERDPLAKSDENLLANRPARSTPITSRIRIESVPKKTKLPPINIEPSPAAETKIDKVTPRRTRRKPVRKKTPATRKARVSKSAEIQTSAELVDDQIRTRAYFISERRRRFGLPGDASSDWLEAKRQLLSELGPR
jgi:hypothetical protein